MKKNITKFIIMLFMALLIMDINTGRAKADDESTGGEVTAPTAYQIAITQYPSKVTYARGESLELSDMVVTGYFLDGTVSTITDYQIIGYNANQVGSQTVIVTYQNLMAAFTVTVLPAKVTNLTVSEHTTGSISLAWDADSNATRYEVYVLDEYTGIYYLLTYAFTNRITLSYPAGTVHTFRIAAVENVLGIDYRSDYSDSITAATNPEAVAGLTVTETTPSTIALSWTQVPGATGYLIYRSPAGKDSFKLCKSTDALSYTDEGLTSGQGYQYKVCAFVYEKEYAGAFSSIVDVSTNPAKIALKYKAGEGKIRFILPKVNGADTCEVYAGDEANGYQVLLTTDGNGGTFVVEGLVTGKTYNVYAIARRVYNGVTYDSPASDLKKIEITPIPDTSTEAKLFKKKQDFLNSWSYKTLTYFAKYVDYSKSYIIPGLITTNVDGFTSTTMCPQGITFAEGYLLVSAYDLSGEENSVIYVMNKKNKILLTTLVLPSKPHAGGLCYDGYNVWVTNGSKLSAIPFSVVDKAAKKQEKYAYVKYSTTVSLGITASYTTYYDGKIWVGTYNELQKTNMYSYTIENKETEPKLTKKDTILMPDRVQGVAFTNAGTLIISRSCQLYQGLRGYMRQIDSYKPQFDKAVKGVIPLGNLVNSVSMPSMNEGIAIDGSYLYVNFESGAFDKSTYRMDRICAFKLTDIVWKKDK